MGKRFVSIGMILVLLLMLCSCTSTDKEWISADYADEYMLLHGAYHHYIGSESEYAVAIAFKALGTLQNVTIFGYEFGEDDYIQGADLFTLPEMTEEMPLVAELDFPGDMSMYGIRFEDEDSTAYVYSIYISGKDSSIILSEEQ